MNTLYCHLKSLICHNIVTTQNMWFFQDRLLKVLKCYNFLWVQRRHNCSPAASFYNLRFDTIPVKSASANVSCRKWAIRTLCVLCFNKLPTCYTSDFEVLWCQSEELCGTQQSLTWGSQIHLLKIMKYLRRYWYAVKFMITFIFCKIANTDHSKLRHRSLAVGSLFYLTTVSCHLLLARLLC